MENRVNKMMALASAAWGLLGAAALSTVTPASASFSPRARPAGVFDSRTEVPVRHADVIVPAELRPSSPMPYAGSAMFEAPVAPPEPIVASLARDIPPAPRERHELTSFDGAQTMTDGGTISRAEPSSVPPAFRPTPVVWNNPLQWIGVHKHGL